MTHYNARFYTDKGVEIFDKKIECTPANIPEVLACIVTDYLKSAPYPGTIKARVTDGRCNMGYMLLLDNDAVDVYRHVGKNCSGRKCRNGPGVSRFQGTPEQGGICLMTHYDVRLHMDKGVEISNKGIESTPENIPGMLASIVMDYLKDAPYPGVIKAGVTGGRHHTEYTLLIENNKLHAYIHVKKSRRRRRCRNDPGTPPARNFQTGRRWSR